MQAIQVKFLPATTHRGTRVKAFSQYWKATVPYSHEHNPYGNARAAANELLSRSGWALDGVQITGSGVLPCGDHVFTVGFREGD